MRLGSAVPLCGDFAEQRGVAPGDGADFEFAFDQLPGPASHRQQVPGRRVEQTAQRGEQVVRILRRQRQPMPSSIQVSMPPHAVNSAGSPLSMASSAALDMPS